jgi:predicted nucleic acid-binding protein
MGGTTERPVIICDASVALAWLLDEPAPAWATALWESVLRGRADVKVPDLFWLEIGNHYVRRRDLAGEQVLEGIVRLEALGFQTIEMDRSLRLMAIHLAQQFRLSTYDGLYLALADTSGLPLATLDRRLSAAAAALGHGYGDAPASAIRETSVNYGADRVADPMSLAALGAYLAELREEILTGA